MVTVDLLERLRARQAQPNTIRSFIDLNSLPDSLLLS